MLRICLLMLLAMPSAELAAEAPLVVAHRGLLKHAPENTLANFRACLELRLGFEFDVRRTSDGCLVCVHDDTVDRTTDGHGEVEKLTLAEIRRLDAGSWFDERFRGERVPTIDEVLELLAEYRNASVLAAADIKGTDESIERDLVQLAQKHRVLDKLIFIGTTIEKPQVRARLRAADAAAASACLANRPEEFDAALADSLAQWVYLRYVPSRAEVDRVHALGKRVFIAGRTVAGQEIANWRSTIAAGIDGVLTDYPLELESLKSESRRRD